MITAIVIGAPLLLLVYMLIEGHWLKVSQFEFADTDIPQAFDGVTIAFLADIHHGPWISLGRVQHVVDVVNGLNPDIVLLGGDYVHRSADYVEPCFKQLSRIEARLGTYAVLGNHDHWEGADSVRRAMKDAGITLLDNRAQWITIGGDRIKIGGVGDLWEDSQDLEPTIHDAATSDFVILLSHNPDYVDEIDTDRIDLVLCGHTHGGQVTLFGKWAPLVPLRHHKQKYRAGLVETGHVRMYVTTGIGTVTPPVRLFCRPEIALITIRRK
jgi:predicted MPP superfamily phosphohydrolase